MLEQLERQPLKVIAVCRKAWNAYAGMTLFGLVLLVLSLALMRSRNLETAGAMALVCVLVFVVYRIALLRSYRLYFDFAGVWLSWGVLPWATFSESVKWRDLEGAAYRPSLWSWLSGSYAVHVRHRFDKTGRDLRQQHQARKFIRQ